MTAIDWKERALAAEDALRRARSRLWLSPSRKRFLSLLADLPAGRTLTTGEIAAALSVRLDTAKCSLHKLADAGLVDLVGRRASHGRPLRWKLGHMVVVEEG